MSDTFTLTDDVSDKVELFPHHFHPSKDSAEFLPLTKTDVNISLSKPLGHSWAVGRVMGAASLLNLMFKPPASDEDEKVQLNRAELESLRSEIAALEERESSLRAQLQNIDEVLRSAWLCGYLFVRTRWTELPGEPPILDDADVDDWLSRFVVFQGSCIYYYLHSTDLSPQDSTLLSEISEVGLLPSFLHENGEQRYAFYLLTNLGLRVECSSISDVQVDAWVRMLRTHLESNTGSSSCDLQPQHRK